MRKLAYLVSALYFGAVGFVLMADVVGGFTSLLSAFSLGQRALGFTLQVGVWAFTLVAYVTSERDAYEGLQRINALLVTTAVIISSFDALLRVKQGMFLAGPGIAVMSLSLIAVALVNGYLVFADETAEDQFVWKPTA